MTQSPVPKKHQALAQLRQVLSSCTVCGAEFDEVNANSHKTSADPESVRFYFQFVHGDEECIDQVMARDFTAWLKDRTPS